LLKGRIGEAATGIDYSYVRSAGIRLRRQVSDVSGDVILRCSYNGDFFGRAERQELLHGARVGIQRILGKPKVGLQRDPCSGQPALGHSWVALPANITHPILSLRIR
jgi:hypothetical protein